MILRSCLLACLAIAVLGGCTTFDANRADIADRIQAMLNDHEYARALETVDLVKPGHADYQRIRAWRAVIVKKAARWQAELIAEIDTLRAAGQWYNASLLFDEGAAKLPPSAAFEQARRDFELRRAAYRYGLDLRLALAQGRGLPTEIRALEQLYALDPTDEAMRRNVEDRQQALVDARVRLVACGRESLNAGNTEQATACLKVADDIARTDDVERMLMMARRNKDEEKNKKRVASKKREKRNQARRVEDLWNGYEASLRKGDLNAARGQLDKLILMQPSNADLHRQRAAVDSRIEIGVAKSLRDGRELYTQGNFEGAHAVWVAGLQLDPENEELKTSIARAERVLDKLRQLSNQQSSTN